VEQNHVERLGGRAKERAFAGVLERDQVSLALEPLAERMRHFLFVFDDEDGRHLGAPYDARHASGCQEDPSGSFLKCELVKKRPVRYCGSCTIVVTTSQTSPLSSGPRTLKYSVSTVLALYGTPFLRR